MTPIEALNTIADAHAHQVEEIQAAYDYLRGLDDDVNFTPATFTTDEFMKAIPPKIREIMVWAYLAQRATLQGYLGHPIEAADMFDVVRSIAQVTIEELSSAPDPTPRPRTCKGI